MMYEAWGLATCLPTGGSSLVGYSFTPSLFLTSRIMLRGIRTPALAMAP